MNTSADKIAFRGTWYRSALGSAFLPVGTSATRIGSTPACIASRGCRISVTTGRPSRCCSAVRSAVSTSAWSRWQPSLVHHIHGCRDEVEIRSIDCGIQFRCRRATPTARNRAHMADQRNGSTASSIRHRGQLRPNTGSVECRIGRSRAPSSNAFTTTTSSDGITAATRTSAPHRQPDLNAALEAVDLLKAGGTELTMFDPYSINPIDSASIRRLPPMGSCSPLKSTT